MRNTCNYFPTCFIFNQQRQVGIGLPDRPVVMHDLNLEEMVVHRSAVPLNPTGKLKVQFQYSEDRTSLMVIIIEVIIMSRSFNDHFKDVMLNIILCNHFVDQFHQHILVIILDKSTLNKILASLIKL